MTVETREKQIGANTFRLTLFGAKEGQRVLFRLTKILGPALGTLFGSAVLPALKGKSLASILDLDLDLGAAIQKVFESATEADLDFLNDAFAARTEILIVATQTQAGPQRVPINLADRFEAVFARNYGDWITWLTWAIQENYADFFAFKGPAKSGPPGAGQSTSTSPPG